jgi:hypothetical protein
VIRYDSGVWSDHRRGMFHGATERQGATKQTAARENRGAQHSHPARRPLPASATEAPHQYHTTHRPPAPRERRSAEPWTMAPLEVRIDGPCVLSSASLRQGEKTTPRGARCPCPALPATAPEGMKQGALPPNQNSAPTRCGGILDTPACSPVPHMMGPGLGQSHSTPHVHTQGASCSQRRSQGAPHSTARGAARSPKACPRGGLVHSMGATNWLAID